MKNSRIDPTLEWLLDPASPGVCYLALRDLLGLPEDDPEMIAARKAAHLYGPIAAILAKMHPDGYWVRPGAGYNPRYYSAAWSLVMLAQLGARADQDERIRRACAYLLDASLTPNGQFTMNGTPSGTIDCLQGNLCSAMVALGFEDRRLELAFEWMARSVNGEGIAPAEHLDAPLRYYASKCGPLFACGYNNKLSCAWGAIKVMLAFSKWPLERRTPLIEDAIQQGVNFLLGTDPVRADYPTRTGDKPSRNWWKLGFPVFYITDILQILEALLALGYGYDPRLVNALALVRQKQDEDGRWALEFDYAGRTWVDFGALNQPSPWVTLRVLRVLKLAGKGSFWAERI
jgi:hypothetical protein